MCKRIIIAALALAAAGSAGAGEIYRCVAANGEVTYTNIACPAKSKVEHVASYEPDDYVPPPQDDTAARAAEDSASAAREAALQAREAALQARIASEQAQEEEQPAAAPVQESGLYSPYFVPVFVPPATRFHERHGRERHDQVLHLEGPVTPVRTPHWAAPPADQHDAHFRGRP